MVQKETAVKYNRLGKTELKVSAVGLSLADGLPGGSVMPEQGVAGGHTYGGESWLQVAFDNGITWFDVGQADGDTTAFVSQWLRTVKRDDVVLATRIADDEDVSKQIDHQLQLLGTDYLDIVQLECPNDGLSTDAERALQEAKEKGKIRYVGLVGDVDEVMFGLVNGAFDVVQVEYHVLNARAMQLALPLARQLGVGVLTRPFRLDFCGEGIYGGIAAGPVDGRKRAARVVEVLEKDLGRKEPMDLHTLEKVSLQLACASGLVHGCLVRPTSREHICEWARITDQPPLSPSTVAAWLREAGGVDQRMRCAWADDPLLAYYHDVEWGRPPRGDHRWFEFVVLETFQAGLSWKTILHKRRAFRRAFSGFDIDKVAAYTVADVERLMGDASIVRHRKKIEAAVENARIAQRLVVESGSLERFFLDKVKPAADPLEVIRQTFRFVGRTTAESIAFATGIVPPLHTAGCWLARS
jgi:DNA-3-methyladenine glycosylase I